MQEFSVLMSVYHKERADYLCAALESVFSQTVLPDEVVLVEDGRLTPELDAVVENFRKQYRQLKVVSLPRNVGLGRALNEGLKHCSFELVARMDTDDIAKPFRFERQLAEFRRQPDLDVCSAWMEEFSRLPEEVDAVKTLPEGNEALYEYGKRRNPVNHPVVMFRKQAVVHNGGYRHYPLFEDYYLWVRMMMSNCRFYTIPEALQAFRASREMFLRRGAFGYALVEVRLQFLFYGMRYITFGQMLKNIAIRFIARVMPASFRARLYRRRLRS